MTPQDIDFRFATRADLPSIVRMLADDDLGRQRERVENPLPDRIIQPSTKLIMIPIMN